MFVRGSSVVEVHVYAVEKEVRQMKVEDTQRFKRIYKIDKVQQFLIYKTM